MRDQVTRADVDEIRADCRACERHWLHYARSSNETRFVLLRLMHCDRCNGTLAVRVTRVAEPFRLVAYGAERA